MPENQNPTNLTEPDWDAVRRTAADGGPADPWIDTDWPDLWQLRWHAARIEGRTGYALTVAPTYDDGHFSIYHRNDEVIGGGFNMILSVLTTIETLHARGLFTADKPAEHTHDWSGWHSREITELYCGKPERVMHMLRRQCATCPCMQEACVDVTDVPAPGPGVWLAVPGGSPDGISPYGTQVDALRDAVEVGGNAFFVPFGTTLREAIEEWSATPD
ncbi:hypothetical protein ABZ413_29675 [Nocardia rhamnosiphila]|uniref:hypothetical protein n=1 Tax=Nocardia rhamnosiphila TaxID=426716 RepID=UPI0034020BFA